MKYRIRDVGGTILATTVSLLLLLGACRPKGDAIPAGDPAVTAIAPPDTSHPTPPPAAGSVAGMATTGDADHDFLRTMSDHHKGLIAMAHETMEAGRGTAQSRADAGTLDAKQDEELKQLVTMLDTVYRDPFEPKVTVSDQEVLAALLKQSGSAYAATFYRSVVAHHREALIMIDKYLLKATHPDLKRLAERMKLDQTREIAEFQRKAVKP